MKRYLLFTILILTVALVFSVRTCNNYRNDRNRLSDNQRSLLVDVEFYQTKDSLNTASVERLTLTNKEFKQYCVELERMVEKLNLKVKCLQSVSQTAFETKYQVKTEIRDSIVMLPGRIDTLCCIDYRNDYLTLSGCIESRQFSGLIESRDTIVQVVHRVPRRFWFIRWGTKGIRQEVISRNPYSRIVYTEYIELKR